MNAEGRPSPGARERELFLRALEKNELPEREAFLDAACGGDQVLRGSVEELLRKRGEIGNFLEKPALSGIPAPSIEGGGTGPPGTGPLVSVTEKPGDRIGRYKLLQKVGEGGCGVVYMAEQEQPVRRRVALKVIKLGMDTQSVIARFEAERQALALMDHPNIAKVLDGGATETGRPYFVMELVRGIRITEYCDQNNLSTEERLKLFIQVCRAIQHAHQKGLIHRDIKPSNILVTLHDGTPVSKVIDFGIAKATEQRLTDKTLFTGFQAFIGTPAYTSPEQAEMSGLDIDTRSDIYSLGVLLYELLTGKTPFDPKHLLQSGLDEMRRIIREEEPLRPSTRLSTLGMVEALALTKARQVKMGALVEAVRGDLDWIVMKCLEKDRTRRYETANGLAMDVLRTLNNEPVLARPPSTAYRIQKFVSRNKASVAAGAAVAIVLALAAVVSTWMAIRATQAENEQSRLYTAAEAALKNEAKQRGRAETQQLAALRRAYNSDMNLVQQALAAKNLGRVVDLLNRHRLFNESQISDFKSQIPSDFRQWEWRYFWSQSQSAATFALPQQSNRVEAMALSPNGRLLASADRQGALKLWDLTTQAEVPFVREALSSSSAFAFSHDGGRLAAAINDGRRRSKVKVWTVATRQVAAELAYEGGVDLLAFSPDDTKLLTWGQDMAVRVWDFDQQQFTQRIPGPRLDGWRKVAVFSSERTSLAIGEGGRIHLLDLATGAEKTTLQAFEGDVASMAFSPDGELLAASPLFTGTSTTIKLFSTSTGKEAGQLIGHVSWIPGLTFTADGRRLVSAGADQTVRIWDVQGQRELSALRGHLSEVNCVAVSADGKTIVSGCKDGTLFGWDAERIQRKKPFETLPMRVASLEFFPDSQKMLSVNAGDGTVSLWDPDTLQETERISALGNNVTRVLVSSDGTRLYAGTQRGEIKVLDWATRLVITNLAVISGRDFPFGPRGPRGPGGLGGPIGLVDKGRTLVVVGAGSAIRLFDTDTWEPKTEWKANAMPAFFGPRTVLSPDERFLLVAGRDGAIEFRSLFNGQTEATLPGQNWGVSGIAFSSDGGLLATSSGEGTVTLWDPSERKVVDVLHGHLLGVHAVAFSPDGQRLATASHSAEAVKLWDVATRHEVATLAGEGTTFDFVEFSPDGKLLVAINAQNAAHLWRAPSLDDINRAEGRQVRITQGR